MMNKETHSPPRPHQLAIINGSHLK